MANLSQEKRQRLRAFLETIREEHKDDDEVLIVQYNKRKDSQFVTKKICRK